VPNKLEQQNTPTYLQQQTANGQSKEQQTKNKPNNYWQQTAFYQLTTPDGTMLFKKAN